MDNTALLWLEAYRLFVYLIDIRRHTITEPAHKSFDYQYGLQEHEP